ncbi:MAG: DUF1302 family protein [Bacteroidales bacterium]|nr:DUF1302 family protein [Bacteroidales bacterium]
MKAASFSLFVIVFLIAPCVIAQDNPLIWRGSIESDQRLRLEDEQEWLWNENRLDLQLEKRAMPLRIVGNVWLRHLGPSITETSSDLFLKDKVHPWSLDIREAYVEVYGFLSDDLDLKVGRQQINWGTADRFNPTRTLNSPDLEDILDFGRMMGSDAISLQWHFSHSTSLQGVFVPLFRPATLPLGAFSALFAIQADLPEGISIHKYSDNLLTPPNTLKDASSFGLRLRSFLLNTDVSVSYVFGRNAIPVPSQAELTMVDHTHVDMHATFIFPRHHVFGADLAGSIGRVGVWAEAAVFIPEEEVTMLLIAPPMPEQQTPIIEKEPYARFVVGGDYTFGQGTYLNLQYVHGFLHESGKGNLNDYLFLQAERSFRNNTIVVQPLSGGISIADRDNLEDNYALFYTPEIRFRGIDNLEVALGGFFFAGKGDHLFASLKDKNMLRLFVKASF